MAKKTPALAIQPTEPTANLAVEFGTKDYEIASAVIAKCYGALRYHGTALMLARLMIAVPLAQIRAFDLANKTKGLSAFYKLAERGGVNLPKMSKRSLERCLQVFDAYCKDKGIAKKDVLALPGINEVKDEQLELWHDGTPENASPLLRDLMEWSRNKGLTLLDNEIQTAITPPPVAGGDDATPSDPAKLAMDDAQAKAKGVVSFFETDLFAQLTNGEFLNHEDKAFSDHPCTWSLLPKTSDDPTVITLNKLHLILGRWSASTERLLQLTTGKAVKKPKKAKLPH